MRVSPCKGCPREFEDKNHPDCALNCKKRVEYSNSHGFLFESVPLEVKKMDGQKTEDAQSSNVEESGYQVCKDEDCNHAGKSQPISKFNVHWKSKKPIEACKDCVSRKRNITRERNRPKVPEEDRPDGVIKIDPKNVGRTVLTPLTLTINFKDHPEALEAILKKAKEAMREPEAQVLYWMTRIVDAMEKRG